MVSPSRREGETSLLGNTSYSGYFMKSRLFALPYVHPIGVSTHRVPLPGVPILSPYGGEYLCVEWEGNRVVTISSTPCTIGYLSRSGGNGDDTADKILYMWYSIRSTVPKVPHIEDFIRTLISSYLRNTVKSCLPTYGRETAIRSYSEDNLKLMLQEFLVWVDFHGCVSICPHCPSRSLTGVREQKYIHKIF